MELKILTTGANGSGFSSMITINGNKCLVNAGDRFHYHYYHIISTLTLTLLCLVP